MTAAPPLVDRLREQLTLHLPPDVDLATVALIRRMMIERSEATNEIDRLHGFVDQIGEHVATFLEAEQDRPRLRAAFSPPPD
jgi:hypothetical protein